MNWYKIENVKPPLDIIIKTKIDDGKHITNEQSLIFDGKLWWHIDKSMYIYYQPTHWSY